MSQPSPLSAPWRCLLAIIALGAIHQLAPWPGPQAIFQAFLVLAVASGFQSPLAAVLWAVAGGWVLEGSLRDYPHLGGTALANMTICLLAHWHFQQRPPESRLSYLGQMAALLLGLILLTHVLVRIASGPHSWGWGWLWALLSLPIWGSLALRLRLPAQRR